MACLGVEPQVAGWKAQTNPLSYGGTQVVSCCIYEIPKQQRQVLEDWDDRSLHLLLQKSSMQGQISFHAPALDIVCQMQLELPFLLQCHLGLDLLVGKYGHRQVYSHSFLSVLVGHVEMTDKDAFSTTSWYSVCHFVGCSNIFYCKAIEFPMSEFKFWMQGIILIKFIKRKLKQL